MGLTGALASACGEGSGPSTPSASPDPEASAAPQADEPWRFRPTLEEHLPEGAVAEPVLELSEPRQRSVVIVAAVLREGAEQVRIERWTYEQIPNQEDGLRVVDEGVPIVRLYGGGQRSPELDAIRTRLAAPRVVLTRPVGLEVSEPGALVGRLAAAFAVVRNPSAEPRARVEAAASIVRGLDDAMVFERDAIGELASVLVPAPGEPTVQAHSPRRVTAAFDVDGRRVSLELQRKSDGWAIASAHVPAPLPAPTTAVQEDEPPPAAP